MTAARQDQSAKAAAEPSVLSKGWTWIRKAGIWIREAALATVLVFAYPYVLTGPILVGLRDAGLPIILTGLCGYGGATLGRALRGERLRARYRRGIVVVSAVLMVVLMIRHFAYFSRCTDCDLADVVVHFVILSVLSFLARLFLSLVTAEVRG